MSDSSGRALARLLHAPNLAQVVPGLPPEALHQIIRHAGLDACVGLVALATARQVQAVLDVDVWRPRAAGTDDQIDAARFAEWVEVLTDADVALAARTIAGLDLAIAVSALSRFIRVLDPIAAAPYTTLDGERVEPSFRATTTLATEIGPYHVRARVTDAWDAITALLHAMASDHPEAFRRLLDGCRQLSDSRPETDGLSNLLTAAEQAPHDAALGRLSRRAEAGYVEPADARAFLDRARHVDQTPAASRDPNPIAAAYLTRPPSSGPTDAAGRPQPTSATRDHTALPADTRDAEDALAALLAAIDDAPSSRGLLAHADGPPERYAHLRALLEPLAHRAPHEHGARMRELAFLANALAAGCSFQAGPFAPDVAADAAAATCNLGLDWLVANRRLSGAGATGVDLVTAFTLGWSRLYRDVGQHTAARLSDILASVAAGDTKTHVGLLQLRHALSRHRAAGTPWRVHDALDALSTLDVMAWRGLLGLLDECPFLPAVADAVVERRTGQVSATDYRFIATMADIARAQAFVDRVPDLFGR